MGGQGGLLGSRLPGVQESHDLNGDERGQSDQGHHAEGIGDDVAADGFTGSHGEGQQEGGGHGTAGNTAGIEGNADEDGRNEAAHDERGGIAGDQDPVDADAGENADHGERHGTGNAGLERKVHGATGDHAAGDLLDLLVEDLYGRLGLHDVIADEDADGDQNPGGTALCDAAAQKIAHRGKADVHACEEQDQTDDGIGKAHEHADDLVLLIMMGQELEQEENTHDGEGAAQNIRGVLRELLNEL